MGSGSSRTAISAFLGPILINFNYWILRRYYSFLFIRVSLEISLLLFFYFLRFLFYLTITFDHADTEKSCALRGMSYDLDKLYYFKDFIYLFFLLFFFAVRHFTEFINMNYRRFNFVVNI